MAENYLEKYNELIPLHNALKEIIGDFAGICKEIGVDFYLIYGTLLGAARHSDIIPWDDDVDLGMMRSQYDKLIEYFVKNKNEKYIFACPQTSPEHTQIFGKLVRIDEKYNNLKKYYSHPRGLSIDIFPLDEAKAQSNMIQALRGECIVYLRKIVNSRAKLESNNFRERGIRRLMRSCAVLPFCFISNHKLLLFTDYLCKKNNGKGYPNIINYSTTDKLYKENDPMSTWLPAEKLPLGGNDYLVPGQYAEMLTDIYGADWHEIPPESVRGQHEHLEE